jgi:hypothetical protein
MMASNNNSNMSIYGYQQEGDQQEKSNIIAQHQFMAQNERLNSQRLLQQNQQTSMGTIGYQPKFYSNDQNNQAQHQQFCNQQLNYNPNMNKQIQQQYYQPQSQQQSYHPQLLHHQYTSSNLLQQQNLDIEEENLDIDWDVEPEHDVLSNTPKNKTNAINDVIPSRLTGNRGVKRGNNQQDTNPMASNSPPQNTHKKTKTIENNVAIENN